LKALLNPEAYLSGIHVGRKDWMIIQSFLPILLMNIDQGANRSEIKHPFRF
jgi:hypothetical protein